MNTIANHTAPISGLLSLVADALEPTSQGIPAGTVRPAATPYLSGLLGELAGGWMAVKDDGQGWMLLQFAPNATATTESVLETAETTASEPRPLAVRPEFGE